MKEDTIYYEDTPKIYRLVQLTNLLGADEVLGVIFFACFLSIISWKLNVVTVSIVLFTIFYLILYKILMTIEKHAKAVIKKKQML